MRALFARIRDVFRRRQVDEAFREEMAFHKAELTQRHRERGLSVEEARWAAEREFGNSLQVREALREQSGFRVWDNVSGDVHYAWRVVGRKPGFGIAVILILAVGLTAAATLHGLIDAVFLRSLPVQSPHELRAITLPGRSDAALFSRGTVDRWISRQPAGTVVAFTGAGRGTVQAGTRPVERVRARLVVGSSLKTLGVNPIIGRGLTEQDDRIGAPEAVAVVAASWAQQSFGRPADALHREILVNRVPVTIVGVLPSAFRDVAVGEATDIWLPASLQLRLRMHGNSRTASGDDRENHADWNQEERVSWLRVMFRSKDDDREAMASLRQAWEPERESVAQTLTNPDERQHLRRTAWESVPSPSGQSRFRDEFRATGQLLVGVVTVMLILVCANVSGLLMVRSMSRHREIGVRLALGASGWRVARLAVMEALLLSLIGGGVAWLASSWLLPLAVRMLAPGMDLEAELGTRTVLFMLGLSVCCALASALGPAVWISRTRPLTAISGNLGLGQAPVRFSRILVVAQFTVAVFLVAAATHLGNVLRQTLQADHGFDRTQVLTAQFDVETAGYTRSEVPGVLTRLQDTLLAVPGVERVSFSSSGILAGSHSSSGVFTREGRAKGMLEYVQHDAIVPGYLRTVGLTLRSGRDFSDSDGETAPPVALISANLAQRWFGTDQVVGKIFGFGSEPSSEDWTIVGVVANNRPNGVREQSAEIFYLPVKQWKHEYPRFLAIRFSGAESPVRAGVSVALTRVEPGLVFSGWKTLDDRVKDDLGRVYATTQLAGIFGGCALVLAGTGIAGALSYLVVLRQKDLALRMAVGSEPDHVLRLVLGDALHLGLVGSALGGAAVVLLPLIPFFESVFSGRPGLIPAVLAAGTAVLTALIAGYIPARRAARVDPLVLLKSD